MFQLGPVIGPVRRGVVHVLVQVESMVNVTITVNGDDYLHSETLLSRPGHPTVFRCEDVRSNRDYTVKVEAGHEKVDGSFTTKDGPIHVISCNKLDRLGTLSQMAESKPPSLCLHIGDQVYCDHACDGLTTYTGMVTAYRQRYIDSWSSSLMQKILSSRCNAMIMDDHDVMDSWDQLIRLPESWSSIVSGGGWPALAGVFASRRERAIIAGLQVYTEYQLALAGLHVPGSYTLSLGEKDILMIDARTARASRAPLLDIDEHREFDIIISPIPIFLVSDFMLNKVSAWLLKRLRLRDAADTWNIHPEHRRQVINMMKVGNPLLICGDAHMCGHTMIDGQMHQLTTSSITTTPAPKLLRLILRMAKRYRSGGVTVNHLHWTRKNNYLMIPVEGEPIFIIPDA